jgi:hypothetical protein
MSLDGHPMTSAFYSQTIEQNPQRWNQENAIWSLVLLEHVILIIMLLLSNMINDVPECVIANEARRGLLRLKAAQVLMRDESGDEQDATEDKSDRKRRI